MYCTKCGHQNPDGSKFCQSCGQNLSEIKSTQKENIDSETPPYPYVVSTWKLVILSITTLGLYEVYWFYKQWKSLKADRNLKVTPWLRAAFAGLMAYSLFKEISKAIHELDNKRHLEAAGLAIAYFVLLALWKLPPPYWWISILSFLPLISAQNAINYYWDKRLGDKL